MTMSDEDYAKWKELNQAAAEAMRVADEKRATAGLDEWRILAVRAIGAQEMATNFAKNAIR